MTEQESHINGANLPSLQGIGLECHRGDNLLFGNLHFTVTSGQTLQIEGTNGSGKTSLLRILAGLSPPTEGDVRWRGVPIEHQQGSYCNEMSYLGHHLGLKGELTAHENIRVGLALKGIFPTEKRLEALFERLGILDRQDIVVRALSAGQRQRVALARVAASDTLLWILDEPFTSLDFSGVSLVQNIIEEHVEQGGLVVLTSHQAVALKGGVRMLALA